MRISKGIRLQAFITVCLYSVSLSFFPEVSQAAEPYLLQGSIQQQFTPQSPDSFTLPAALGHIEDTYQGHGGRIVFLVQDAHAVPAAQKSIQKMMSYLNEKNGVRLALLEGVVSKLDPALFRAFPDHEILTNVFGQYREAGELSGASMAAVLGPEGFRYEGLEDENLYEKQQLAFASAFALQAEREATLVSFEQEILKTKKQFYSQELFLLDEKAGRFYQNTSDGLAGLLDFFIKQKTRVPAKDTAPHFFALFSEWMESKEKSAAPADLENELNALYKKAEARADSKEARMALHFQYQAYQTEKLTMGAFAAELARFLDHEETQALSPALSALTHRAAFLENMKGELLYQEAAVYVEELKEKMFKNKEARSINALDQRLRLLQKLSKLELARREWNVLNQMESVEAISAANADILTLSQTLGALSAEWLSRGHDLNRFYEIAELRESIFDERLLSSMQTQGQETAVVVAGGFHTAGLAEALRQKNISHVVMTPAIDELPVENLYHRAMLGDVSWAEHFKVKNGRIDLYSAFSQAATEKLLERIPASEKAGVIKNWRDEVIRGLAAQKNLGEAGEYLTFIDQAAKLTTEGLESEGRTEWLEKVARFVEGLKLLRSENKVTPAALSNLLRTQTATPSVANPLERAKYLSESLRSAAKAASEMRELSGESAVDFSRSTRDRIASGRSFNRSEVRQSTRSIPLMIGIHDTEELGGQRIMRANWVTMETLGAELLRRVARGYGTSASLEDLKQPVQKTLRGYHFSRAGSDENLRKQLDRMVDQLGTVKKNGDEYSIIVNPRIFAIQMSDVNYILNDLNSAIERIQKGEENADAALRDLITDYADAAESWPFYPVEANWPVLKAVTLLAPDKQEALYAFLADKSREDLQTRPLVDAILIVHSDETPENWLLRNAPNLKGATIIYASPETYLAAGGLGRVGQNHTTKGMKLIGANARLVSDEPMYDSRLRLQSSQGEHGEVVFSDEILEGVIDYTQVTVPVQGLHKTMEFNVRATKRGQRHDVTLEVFEGVNEFGVEVVLFRDKTADGEKHYFTRLLYAYGSEYDSATWEEFSEFISKAMLKMSKRIRHRLILEEGEKKPVVLWANDGQTALLPVYKRISDRFEKFLAEAALRSSDEAAQWRQRIMTDDNLKWKDLFGGEDNTLIRELRDLVQEDSEAELADADVHQTTHTYRNRKWVDAEALRKMAIPQEYDLLFESVLYHGMNDVTGGGLNASESSNGVALIHAAEQQGLNPDTILNANTNGDDLAASGSEFIRIFEEQQFLESNSLDPTPEQIMKVKPQAKQAFKETMIAFYREQGLMMDAEQFELINPEQMLISYSGRNVVEKVDLESVFTKEHIQALIKKGVQVVLFANVQAGKKAADKRDSKSMYETLKEWQKELNGARQPGDGALIVATGWGIPEQRSLMAATDMAVYVSKRDKDRGTEAAGYTEANYNRNGAIVMVSSFREALFTNQGMTLNFDQEGSGQTVVPEDDTREGYWKAFESAVNAYQQDRRKFATWQVTSVHLSRILKAELTMAAYLRLFNLIRGIKTKPLEYLEAYIRGRPEGDHFKNQWLREILFKALENQPGALRFGHTDSADVHGNLKVFTMKVGERQRIVVLRKGSRQARGRNSTTIANGKDQAFSVLLRDRMGLVDGDRVIVTDARPGGQAYNSYSVKDLIEKGLWLGLEHEDLQVLDIELAGREAFQGAEPADINNVFHTGALSEPIQRALLELLPEEFMREVAAQGYSVTPANIIWHTPTEGYSTPESDWPEKPLFMVVRKGNRGKLSLTLTPEAKDVFSPLESRRELVREGHAFAHISLEASGETLKIGFGKIRIQDHLHHEAFSVWLNQNLKDWSAKLGFRFLQITQLELSETELLAEGFHEDPESTPNAKLWQMELKREVDRFAGPEISDEDAAILASKDLTFDFDWGTSLGQSIPNQVKGGVLAFLENANRFREQGDLFNQTAAYHTTHEGVSPEGDVLHYLVVQILPRLTGRGLIDLRQKMEALVQEARQGDGSAKKQATEKAIGLMNELAMRLAWKFFREHLTGLQNATRYFEEPQTGNFFRNYLLRYLASRGTKVDTSDREVIAAYAVPLSLLIPDARHDQQAVIAVNLGKARVSTPERAHTTLRGKSLRELLSSTGRVLEEEKHLQLVRVSERRLQGSSAGHSGTPVRVQELFSRGAVIDIPGRTREEAPGPVDVDAYFFEEGEPKLMAVYLNNALRGIDPGESAPTDLMRQELETRKNDPEQLKTLLEDIVSLSPQQALEQFGAHSLPLVMDFVTALVPELLESVKNWDTEAYRVLKARFEADRQLFQHGKIEFHTVASSTGIVFSRTQNGIRDFFGYNFTETPVERRDDDGKVGITVRDIENLGLMDGKTYQVLSVDTGVLYDAPHTLQTLRPATGASSARDDRGRTAGWHWRVPAEKNRQRLRFVEAEIKHPEAVHRQDGLMVQINLANEGTQVSEDGELTVVNSLETAKAEIELLAKAGAGIFYLTWAMEMSEQSEDIHTVHDGEDPHFLPSRDGRTVVRVGGYPGKTPSVKYTGSDGLERVIVINDQRNPFAPLRRENGQPKLNPELFPATPPEGFDEDAAIEKFKNFVRWIHEELGAKVIMDGIFWYAPEDVNETNYQDFFYLELPEADQRAYQKILKKNLTETQREIKIQAFIGSILARRANDGTSNFRYGGYFAKRITENGQERVIVVQHFRGANIDQAMPNPFSLRIREKFLNYLKFLVDLGADGIRIDLAGRLLNESDNVKGIFNLPGILTSAPYAADDEVWSWITPRIQAYARDRNGSNAVVDLILEAYSMYDVDEPRRLHALDKKAKPYYKPMVDAYHQLERGVAGATSRLDASFMEVFHAHLLGYESIAMGGNFDEVAMHVIGGDKAMLMKLLLLANAGVNVMIDLAALRRMAVIRSLPGGGEGHTVANDTDFAAQATAEGRIQSTANAPGLHWLETLNQALKYKGQSAVAAHLLSSNEGAMSSLFVREPETDNGTLVVSYHGLQGDARVENQWVRVPRDLLPQVLPAQSRVVRDLETDETFSIQEDGTIEGLSFGSGDANVRMLRIEKAARSELRLIAAPIVASLAEGTAIELSRIELFAEALNRQFEPVLEAFQVEAQAPNYFSKLGTDGASADQSVENYLALEEAMIQFSAQSPQIFAEAIESYLASNDKHQMHFNWIMPFDSTAAEWLKALIETVSRLSNQEAFQGRVSVNAALLVSEADRARYPDRLAELGKTAGVEVIRRNVPSAAKRVNDFLNSHKNAVAFDLDAGLKRNILLNQHFRLVAITGLSWRKAFPISAAMLFKIAQDPKITAETLRKIPEIFAGGLRYHSSRGQLVINALAERFVLEASMARMLATMA